MDGFNDDILTKGQQEVDEKHLDAGFEAKATCTTEGATEPEFKGKPEKGGKVLRLLLGKRASKPGSTDEELGLKKKKLEDSKTQDVANAAPFEEEGDASNKKQEQEAFDVTKMPPGSPKAGDGTPQHKGVSGLIKDDEIVYESLEGIEAEVTNTTDEGIKEEDATEEQTEEDTSEGDKDDEIIFEDEDEEGDDDDDVVAGLAAGVAEGELELGEVDVEDELGVEVEDEEGEVELLELGEVEEELGEVEEELGEVEEEDEDEGSDEVVLEDDDGSDEVVEDDDGSVEVVEDDDGSVEAVEAGVTLLDRANNRQARRRQKNRILLWSLENSNCDTFHNLH
ncbi:sodium/potassium/calcium exchanger 1-like [Drosophila serrata]|uniref:sodium/potassium/calcium exchanger 1-like n=1 Tax=Drosophila serrata TaxID=7274 RepID=UPI000A1D1155|nr:sodium/potassium/calcium exchanger 1-like [Drosophila serrata]